MRLKALLSAFAVAIMITSVLEATEDGRTVAPPPTSPSHIGATVNYIDWCDDDWYNGQCNP
jgi:hypothetical protein